MTLMRVLFFFSPIIGGHEFIRITYEGRTVYCIILPIFRIPIYLVQNAILVRDSNVPGDFFITMLMELPFSLNFLLMTRFLRIEVYTGFDQDRKILTPESMLAPTILEARGLESEFLEVRSIVDT